VGDVIYHRKILANDTISYLASAMAARVPASPGQSELNKLIQVDGLSDVEFAFYGSRDAGGDANNDTFVFTLLGTSDLLCTPDKLFEATVTIGNMAFANICPIDGSTDTGRIFKPADTIVPTVAYANNAKLGFYELFNATGTPGNEVARAVIATLNHRYLFGHGTSLTGVQQVDIRARLVGKIGG